jgi:Protein of unknown function (DUF3379)
MNVFDFRTKRALDGNAPEAAFERARSANELSAAEMAFEAQLRAAMVITVPENLVDRILLAQTTLARQQPVVSRRRLWAIAASIAITAIGSAALWRMWTPAADSLVDLGVTHVNTHEVNAPWSKGRIPLGSVRAVFAEFGLPLNAQMMPVSYINRCPLGEHRSIHMVIPTATGPVSALYVAEAKPPAARENFERGQQAGSVVQFGEGALVLIGNIGQDFGQIESNLKRAIDADAIATAAYGSDGYAR